MNILFYYSRALFPHDGGIATISLSLIEGLEGQGHVVTALGKQDLGKGKFLQRQYFLPSIDVLSTDNVDYICNILKEQSIDVVINQQPIDDVAEELWTRVKKQTGIRIISCMHNPVTLSAKNFILKDENRIKKKKLGWVMPVLSTRSIKDIILRAYIMKNKKRYQKIVANSDSVVVLCDGMKDELIEMIGHNDSKIKIIPNFLKSVPVFVPYEKKENVVVWCGQINFTVKRVDIMLAVWKKLQDIYPDWKLYILGDGPDVEAAKRLAKTLMLRNYCFEGRVDPSEYYRMAKYVVVTSSYESFSLVTLEAMANSCIPVGFNTFPAASFLLGDSIDKLFVPPYDIKMLVQKISEVETKSLGSSLQKTLYQRSCGFTSERIIGMWNRLLNDFIK